MFKTFGSMVGVSLTFMSGTSFADAFRVTLSDPQTSYLNCRADPYTSAEVLTVFYYGEPVLAFGRTENGFTFVTGRIGEHHVYTDCWAKSEFLFPSGYPSGHSQKGTYRSAVSDTANGYLTCRKGPGTNFPETSQRYRAGETFEVSRISSDTEGNSWLFTGSGCYTMGREDLVQYVGIGM